MGPKAGRAACFANTEVPDGTPCIVGRSRCSRDCRGLYQPTIGLSAAEPGTGKSGAAEPGAVHQSDALPKPTVAGTVSLEEAIERRRSVRSFTPATVPVGTIGQLLWAGQGVTRSDGRRAAPSAGALYPLELYAVTAKEVMHYLPQGHRAETRVTPDLRPELKAAALDQASVGAAPVVMVVAAEPGRLSQRYGGQADAFTDLEVGHAAQNILLQAVVRGLAPCPSPASTVHGRRRRSLCLPARPSSISSR